MAIGQRALEMLVAPMRPDPDFWRGKRVLLTGHTGWTDNMEFAFAHKDKLCSPFKKRVHDPSAPYDAYDESDDTEERSKSGYLKGVGR